MGPPGKKSMCPADDFDDGDSGLPGYQTIAPVRAGPSDARGGGPAYDSQDKMDRPPSGKGAAKGGRGGPAYDSQEEDEPRPRGGKAKSSRGAPRPYESEEDETEPPRGGGKAKSGRGAPRSYESEDDEPEPPRRGGKAATSRALVVRKKSARAEEDFDDDDDDDDEPPMRGGKARPSRALAIRNRGTRGDSEDEMVKLPHYRAMFPGQLSAHDFHGLQRVFGGTSLLIESWCERSKLVWDNVQGRPSFHKLLAMFPEKEAAWEDWQETGDYVRRRRYDITMEREARREEVAERLESFRIAREVAHMRRYGW